MAEEIQKTEDKKVEDKPVQEARDKTSEKPEASKTEEKREDKQEDQGKTETKTESKDTNPKKRVVKKAEAFVYSPNAHLSPKTSAAVCRFIVGKTIDEATEDLRQVAMGRKAVPMKGEIPHRKGRIMSGRFPKNAAEHFIILLKTLAGNANVNGLEEPVIAEAIANVGNRPFGKFGSVRRKRTHIKIIAKNRNKTKFKLKKPNKAKKGKRK